MREAENKRSPSSRLFGIGSNSFDYVITSAQLRGALIKLGTAAAADVEHFR